MSKTSSKLSKINLRYIAYSFMSHTSRFWGDSFYLRAVYRICFGRKLNLDNPQTFNEKLQWLKLYNRKSIMTTMVDKIEAKKYVADVIGEEYIIPTISIFETVEEIDWDKLPNQFVLKCTHDSGGVVVCKDKNKLNIAEASAKLKKALNQTYYFSKREWPYKNVKPRIICEKYLSNNGEDLDDYKVFNFNNGPQIILVCKDRFKNNGLTEDFFTDKWEHLDIARLEHPNSNNCIKKPDNLEKILELSSLLSKGYPFLRTDFYSVDGKIYFGELTFFPSSGFNGFNPNEWDEKLGSRIILPAKEKV